MGSPSLLCSERQCGNMPPSVGKRSRRERQKHPVIPPSVLFHETKLCLLIYLFIISQDTPLHYSAWMGHVEICRVLVASKGDVAAQQRCRSPWCARNLPLTSCVAGTATLHSKSPSKGTMSMLLRIFAVSALRNVAAPPRQP